MIVGDSSVFAIESEITDIVPNVAQRALGFFVIHVGGRAFGIKAPDASMLGCSFDEVNSRLQRRGTHRVSLLSGVDAAHVADAYLDAIYRTAPRTDYFGLSREQFIDAIHSSEVTWAPDGDEAFDDGSHVLQFDVDDRVRLVAFVNTESPDNAIGTVSEEWLEADLFYGVLSRWRDVFAAEWIGRLSSGGGTIEAASTCSASLLPTIHVSPAKDDPQ